MQCEKCGKILDPKKEKTFCTGCGAKVSPDDGGKPQTGAYKRPVISNKGKPVGITSLETEIRARALYVGAFGGFVLCYIAMSIILNSNFTALLIAALFACFAGIVMMTIIAKSAPSMKSSFHDATSALPIREKSKRLVRSISSALPFIGPLPED
ncbi:MAG TPA: hypothetical protein PKH33_04125 [bacterium]|nr:hypothetical protein [bacterium]